MHEQSACGGEEKERSVQRERQSEQRCRRCFQNDSRALRSKKCAIVWARTWTARILFGLLVRIKVGRRTAGRVGCQVHLNFVLG